MAAELGQQTVEFSSLVRRAAEESYLALKELVETYKPPQQRSDSEKKFDLLKFIVKTQQRMLRLQVLSKWCLQVPLIQYCQQLSGTLSSHDTCFTQTADSLFYMHESLQQARAPIFDVPSAIEILLTGGYNRLPKCIEDLGFQSNLTEDLQKPALKKLEMVLRSKLLDVPIPKEITEVTVSNGTAVLIVDGEFKVFLTLGYRGHLSLWRILHLELLVGEKNEPIKLEETRRYALGDDLERRMAAAENPFLILYTILHELCVSLVMDTVLRQVRILRQTRWKDAIRFELISDNTTGQGVNASAMQVAQDTELDSGTQKIPGLKIIYWLDWSRNNTGSDSGTPPSLKIEPGQDLQIKCSHSSFVFDPVTEKEAELSLQHSCIDVEKLLLKAISCNRYTRLLDIHRELSKNVHLCQAPADVILKFEGDEMDLCSRKKDGGPSVHEFYGDQVLQVRAYSSSYITLRINTRNGRFLLQCYKNILAPSVLLEFEEALNLGSLTATEVFISLRSKSILHLFASIGRSLGLKVYENRLATLKIPKSVLYGSDLILMGFPQSGNSYFLLMQLDKDFRPIFNLLETQPERGGKSQLVSEINHVARFNKIDIWQMEITDDELNLSLLNWEKISSLPNITSLNQFPKNVLPELEPVLQLPDCSQSSFSSIVDEVFESEKDALGNHACSQSFSSSFNVQSFPHMSSLSTNSQGMKVDVGSPKLDGGIQNSQISNYNKFSTGLNNSFYLSGNAKGQLNSNSSDMSSSSSLRSQTLQKLPSSKSEQDLSSLKSPFSSELGQLTALDEEQGKLITSSSISAIGVSRAGQLMSPPQATVSRPTVPISRVNGSNGSSYSHLVGYLSSTGTSSLLTSCQNLVSGTSSAFELKGTSKPERTAHKRALSEILTMIPSLKELQQDTRPWKRMKTLESTESPPATTFSSFKIGEHTYGSLLAEAIRGNAPSNIYLPVLLHVVRHCSLCIKHARLTIQMEALDIPYVEEVGVRASSTNLWFLLPFAQDGSWQHICLRLGKPGSMSWDVRINDQHFQELWELHKGSNSTSWCPGVRIANVSDADSHIHYDPEGVVLCYERVEVDSIERLVSDLRRLSNTRLFARGMRRLIGARADDKLVDSNINLDDKLQIQKANESADKLTEQMKRTFKIEAVGLMSLWFSYGSMPVMAHFVVEWETGKEGCTMHVSPDHLWPHTKFLEDYINGGDVASFLDCIRLTAGPLLSLAAAIPPARMSGPVSTGPPPVSKQGNYVASPGVFPNSSISNAVIPVTSASPTGTSAAAPLGSNSIHNAATVSAAARCVSGIVPSSLLPIDVSVVLRGPYWIRIIYRKKFAVDMRCFAGDQVWLQPATPPKGGPAAGGSLPCPQFRPFIMEHVAQGLNALEPNFPSGVHSGGHMSSSNANQSSAAQTLVVNGNRLSTGTSVGMTRPVALIGNQIPGNLSRVSNNMLSTSGLPSSISGVPMRIAQGTGVPVHVRGELNTAFIGLGDDGGYGGGWVPLAALKKVLRGILKYLGVLWLFAQLPNLLKDILGSILKENEGALLNLDQEQPALRFFIGGYVFAVSVHRVQLLLQVLSVKRFHHQQQQQTQASSQEEYSSSESNELCDYFSRRVASEPYDASRVASFITLLTLPISVVREFLKLIAWKKGLSQGHGGDAASAQRARIELCLENHSGSSYDDSSEGSSASKSNIHHDRAHNSVDFALTFVLDSSNIPHVHTSGGAAWLPHCVSVRLKYSFGDNPHLSFVRMDGSHGGRACWSRAEDWEKCKQTLSRAVDYTNGNSVGGDVSQGRVRLVAEALQRTLHALLQQQRDGSLSSASTMT